MSVQPAQHLYHAHPPADQTQIHANGVHSSSPNPYAAPATNGHARLDDMNPWQQQHPQHQQQHQQHQYSTGYGAPPPQQQQQQQRQYSSNQLPPMYGSSQQPMAGHYPSYGATPAYANQMPPPPLYPSAPPHTQPMLAPVTSAPPQEKQLEMSRSDHSGRYQYALRIEQQPTRARMCGFGDKDRRPITPPPCVRLVITDLHTGKPAQLEQSDGMFFVLQVDLWDDNASKEVNIVRSSSSSPAVSISTATMTSYPPPPERHPALQQYATPGGPQWMYDAMPSITPGGGVIPQQPYQIGVPPPLPPPGYTTQQAASSNSTMFTRNLIGSLTVNAAWLKDTQGNYGFWFVLQDLSVRTEGWFR